MAPVPLSVDKSAGSLFRFLPLTGGKDDVSPTTGPTSSAADGASFLVTDLPPAEAVFLTIHVPSDPVKQNSKTKNN